ncbi:MAG: alpha-mannosidase [Candidatus Sumerlaeota bacterium]|nr:alpha-mannosidase [Candidatus Sumerlaeota bacterium]
MLYKKTDKRIKEIEQHLYSNATPIADLAAFETYDHLSIDEAMRHKGWRRRKVGWQWGRKWWTAWFRLRFTIPRAWAGKAVALRFAAGGEAAVFHKGAPLQGLDVNRDEVRLAEKARGGEEFELYIENSACGQFGSFQKNTLARAEICTVNPAVWKCWHTLSFLRQLAVQLPEESPRRRRLIRAVNRAVDAFDYNHTDEKTLDHSALAALAEVLEVSNTPAEPSIPTAHLIGNSHIDVAWLWPLRETIRKCSRTFSTVIKYMEEYPDYRFAQSQAQLYAFTKERYPALYEKIKRRVRQGRWTPVGGQWVEADCNLAGGESLVRQFLYGQMFFEQEFGIHSKTLWLPDVFGYCAAMPQIIRKSDMAYFVTQKLSWNDTNKMPYTTFWWRGIDGSEVLAHFPPADTYNARLGPAPLCKSVRGMKESDRSDDFLVLYGFGDGGGGPTKEMLENARIGANVEGCPRLKQGTVDGFFEKVERDAQDLPTWVGELYFELHRGTYTTQARNKRNNRRCEFLLRDAEWSATLAMLARGERSRATDKHPQAELAELWRTVLMNQFHDIIPGSSIGLVYEDSDRQYAEIMPRMAALRDEALRALTPSIDTSGPGQPVVVFNSLSWTRTGVAEAPLPAGVKGDSVMQATGAVSPAEIVGRGKNRRLRFIARDVPPMGYAVFHLVPDKADPPAAELLATHHVLENRLLRVRFDRNGLIRSIYDKQAHRDIVPEDRRANVFQLFEDKPHAWDAWDIFPYYMDKGRDLTELESVEVVSEGPIEAALRMTRRFGDSRLEQVIALGADSPRIEFRTRVDWREKEQLLKVAFPTTLNTGAPARATFEIQYGHVERPTHWNTSWDRAKFETCGHKWADLAEADYGVALLNDCKYGHDARDGQIRLSLLRQPKHPDPRADLGEHEFAYALQPHAGDLRQAGIIRAGYEFNSPMTAFFVEPHAGPRPARQGSFEVDQPNVIIEAVKKAEKGTDVIVRLYDSFNAARRATLTLPRAPKQVWECNLMERDLGEVKFEGARFAFDIKPFEIKTFRVRF